MNKHLKYHGQDATVKTYTETGTDSYGDPEYSVTETETKVIVDAVEATTFPTLDAAGRDFEAISWVYVDDDVDINDGTSAPPSQIIVGEAEYEVKFIVWKENGMRRCNCERM